MRFPVWYYVKIFRGLRNFRPISICENVAVAQISLYWSVLISNMILKSENSSDFIIQILAPLEATLRTLAFGNWRQTSQLVNYTPTDT